MLFVVLQPVFSPSVLAEMMRPDGSSTISVLGGESLSSELAHELMGIQVIQRLRCVIIQFLLEKFTNFLQVLQFLMLAIYCDI